MYSISWTQREPRIGGPMICSSCIEEFDEEELLIIKNEPICTACYHEAQERANDRIWEEFKAKEEQEENNRVEKELELKEQQDKEYYKLCSVCSNPTAGGVCIDHHDYTHKLEERMKELERIVTSQGDTIERMRNA